MAANVPGNCQAGLIAPFSALCNPLMLGAYAGLALFYGFLGSSELAAQACSDYDYAEKRLLSIDDNDLSCYDQETKSNAPVFRQWIDEFKPRMGIQ